MPPGACHVAVLVAWTLAAALAPSCKRERARTPAGQFRNVSTDSLRPSLLNEPQRLPHCRPPACA